MRLFIAITLQENIKDSLSRTITGLKNLTRKGSFTDRDNLHLTVVFIGETKDATEIMRAMDRALNNANTLPFQLEFREIGSFKRQEGDIFWVGVEKELNLWKLQEELVKELKAVGIPVDDKEYKPHLTLGRRVKLNGKIEKKELDHLVTPMIMETLKISLMKSERINGKLVYTEIYQSDY
jgi:2'-5' RNA ligase